MRYVRRQDGSEGCSNAHDSDVISGWAADVIDAVEVRLGGRVS